MAHRIAVVPGDGIGTEVIPEGIRVLNHLDRQHGLGLQFETFDLGAERYLRDGTTMPDDVFARWKSGEFEAVYLGALGDPRVPSNVHARDILLGSRFKLDLYVNFRPVRLLDASVCPLKNRGPADIDMTVFRENTEGLYTGVGGQFKRDTLDEVAIEAEMNTRKGVERIIRAAFAYARLHGRTSVCMSDKSNAMRHGGDLWQRVFKLVAAEYPEIRAFHLYVDVLCMEMVRAPERFDVIVTNNLFGDIITDLGAGLQGGLGLAGSGNLNPGDAEGRGRIALFEPVHGSAPDIAGQGIANPLAAILTAGMLLEWIGRPDLELVVRHAVRDVVRSGPLPRDLGGDAPMRTVTDAVLSHLS